MIPVRRLWLLSLPALFACGGGDDQLPEPIVQGNKVSLEIGPEGGTLISKDGLATLVVPPNALATKTLLSVEPKTLEQTSVYEYEPDGLTFAIRASLTLPVEAALRDQEPLVTKFFEDGTFRHHATELSADRSTATAAIPGFSRYGIDPARILTPAVAASIVGTLIKLEFSWGADVRSGLQGPGVRIERARTIGAPTEADFTTVHAQWPVVVDFTEKPALPRSNLANAGIYIAGPRLFALLDGPQPRPFDFGFHVLPRLVGRMHGYAVSEYLQDIGTPAALASAERDWPRRRSGL